MQGNGLTPKRSDNSFNSFTPKEVEHLRNLNFVFYCKVKYFSCNYFHLSEIIPTFAAETKKDRIMTAIQLRAELLRELNPIFDSEVAMLKALAAIRDIRQKVLTQVSVQNTSVRKGWSAAARKAHKQGDDQFVTADIFEDDKVEDWQW